ncbi:MAG: membrane protein insertion efficiency factor YidD [Ruminococcaceae bacterium]|nr:membrane protein insertion efficiency factor YidD [Oscillospiraceae bacterium]
MKELAKKMIAWYQREVSPKTPPSCRFYPTCSTYTYQAVDRYGCIIGCILGFFRIMRCCPLFKGGYDPVPENLLGRKKKTTSVDISDDTENSDNQ